MRESLNEFIWQYRKKENTHIINRTLDDLCQFPFYKQVQNIRTKESWLNQAGWLRESTQAKLELYNPLVMSKQFMLNDATLHNPFNTDYALWVDAGLSNTVSLENYFDSTFERRIIKHLNKMLYVCFPYDGTVEVHGFEKNKLNELADANTQFVARGGIFGGAKFVINEINDIYYNLLDQTLNAGFMGTEESIFTIIAHKHRSKCNIRMIEGNGLVVKFFEDLKKEALQNSSTTPLAFYALTYNLPKQFEMFVNEFKKAFPKEFANTKKYVVDNSDDPLVKDEYEKLFKENDFEIIHQGKNIGINDGRWLAAKHFDESDHEYYIWHEDDFMYCGEQYKDRPCKSGFIRWVPDVFKKSIEIMEKENLDYLKMTYSEFFGTNEIDWSWYNLPEKKKKEYFPSRKDGLDDKLTKVDHISCHRGLSYAVASEGYFVNNWNILFNKIGNKKVFLDIVYEHKYEQTLMSQTKTFTMEGKIKSGCLLASIVEHVRLHHYPREKRKENKY